VAKMTSRSSITGPERVKMQDTLAYPPLGMSRDEAARWVGVSPSLFDQMVKDGRMPAPKQVNSRNVWIRTALDLALQSLPDKQAANPWDKVSAL